MKRGKKKRGVSESIRYDTIRKLRASLPPKLKERRMNSPSAALTNPNPKLAAISALFLQKILGINLPPLSPSPALTPSLVILAPNLQTSQYSNLSNLAPSFILVLFARAMSVPFWMRTETHEKVIHSPRVTDSSGLGEPSISIWSEEEGGRTRDMGNRRMRMINPAAERASSEGRRRSSHAEEKA